MTLLTTELHLGPDGWSIVFAADRRIIRGASPDPDQQKIFWSPSVRIGLGFFGLADVRTAAGPQRMSEWIQDFLMAVPATEVVDGVARRLVDALNRAVPLEWQDEASGFHVAGFDADEQPQFWFVRNMDDRGHAAMGHYEAREEFQRRDAGVSRLSTHRCTGMATFGLTSLRGLRWTNRSDHSSSSPISGP
jgi:hypothetical protein